MMFERGEPIEIRRFDLVAQREPSGFIRHVALAHGKHRIASISAQCPVMHWGPPLAVREAASIRVDLVGRLALDSEDVNLLEITAASLSTQTRLDLPMIADPPWQQCSCPTTGIPWGMRFSCAGFVAFLFRDALEIDLVDLSNLPSTALNFLALVYPSITGERARRMAGLQGSGPWRVLLPGFVVHAFGAGRSAVPYVAQPTDSHWDDDTDAVRLLAHHFATSQLFY